MSDVKWCDLGMHPFPKGQPGSTTVSVQQQVKNQWGGYQPENIVQDVCAACASDAGIRRMGDVLQGKSQAEADAEAAAIRDGTFKRAFGKVRAAISPVGADGSVHDPEVARAKGYDPDYVKWLQEQADEAETDLSKGD